MEHLLSQPSPQPPSCVVTFLCVSRSECVSTYIQYVRTCANIHNVLLQISLRLFSTERLSEQDYCPGQKWPRFICTTHRENVQHSFRYLHLYFILGVIIVSIGYDNIHTKLVADILLS